MTEIVTPDQIIQALRSIRSEAEKGIEAQYQAELDLSKKQLEAERIEASAFIRVGGTVADRTALAKLESLAARQEADIAKAAYNRVKTKLNQLSQAQTALQTQARMVEITWHSAGIESRGR
jgi:hypothetical protein